MSGEQLVKRRRKQYLATFEYSEYVWAYDEEDAKRELLVRISKLLELGHEDIYATFTVKRWNKAAQREAGEIE